MNKSLPGTKTKCRALSVWELHKLLVPVHNHRKSAKQALRERPHFRAILAFVHRNRFAVASQIQRRFSKFLQSDRTTRRHLTELQSLGYLDVVETLNVGPLWPKVYFVTRRGISLLRHAMKEKGKDWAEPAVDRKRSAGITSQHILHELLITEFLLMVWESVQGREEVKLVTIQRRSLIKDRNLRLTVAGRHTRIQPDGVYLVRRKNQQPVVVFLEMDLGTMSVKQMAVKFRRYQGWAISGWRKQYLKSLQADSQIDRSQFRILVVVAGIGPKGEQRRLSQLEKEKQLCPPLIRDRIILTKSGKVRQLMDVGVDSVGISDSNV